MATHIQANKFRTVRISVMSILYQSIETFVPRPRMLIPIGMILTGLGIPTLMAFQLLSVTWLYGIAALALTAIGGVLAFIFSGEV